jgi:hypothetical protein
LFYHFSSAHRQRLPQGFIINLFIFHAAKVANESQTAKFFNEAGA